MLEVFLSRESNATKVVSSSTISLPLGEGDTYLFTVGNHGKCGKLHETTRKAQINAVSNKTTRRKRQGNNLTLNPLPDDVPVSAKCALFFSTCSIFGGRPNLLTIFTTVVMVILTLLPVSDQLPVIRHNRSGGHHVVEKDSLPSAMMYLMKYGYMDHHHSSNKSAPLLSPDGMRDYIMDFQSFAGINQTGELDSETVKWMNMPRCGVKDTVGHVTGGKRRRKRFALQGSRWRVKTLTYKITSYPSTSRLSNSQTDLEIKKALDIWSEQTDLNFKRKRSGKVHIEIRFEEGEHGDGDPFDGQGGTLAHAFFPIFGGDAHFDNDEPWTRNTFRGTNLLQTAAHEFGHSLGLSHSDSKSALMAPFYRGYQSKLKLDKDDILAIQALYGKKSTKPTTQPDNKGNNDEDVNVGDRDNELCRNARFDTIVTVKDDTTYVFKDDKYFKLTDDGIAKGYPKSISEDWDGLPSKLDAAFTWNNGKTYFFRRSQYWRFTNQKMDPNYPKPIKQGFDGIPNFLDAAFVWSGNGKIYFFKGKEYWRFDPESRPPVTESYPKPIDNWEGIPNNIDGALKYSNGYTYFFKSGQYLRFDDKNFEVDEADPPFPRPAGFWWFGCSNPKADISKHHDKSHDEATKVDDNSFVHFPTLTDCCNTRSVDDVEIETDAKSRNSGKARLDVATNAILLWFCFSFPYIRLS